jgi:hypothetical protein
MATLKRFAIGLFVAWGVLVLATAAVAGAFLVHDGIMTVSVREKDRGGANFTVPVPGSAFRLAMYAARTAMPMSERLRLRREVARDLGDIQPVLANLARELRNCPDAVLVEVHDRNAHVTIEKIGGDLRIHIDDRDADVRVTVPASMVSFALDTLGEIAG